MKNNHSHLSSLFAIAALALLFFSPLVAIGEDPLLPPAPVIHNVALQDPDPADGAEDQEDEGLGDLDFLEQDLSDIRQTVTSSVMNEEVTSVSRTAQPVGRSAAAIHVVTNKMIKRSGARNIPDILRTVPGVNVARMAANSWAISIRGFNAQYGNKLLVQIDGRAIYTPTFSGVIWDQEHVLLKDVERIEVIRGPGGTVWGANAVNGIINIVTKSTADTTGLYAEVGGGNEQRFFSSGRVGGQLSPNATYRVYGMTAEDDGGYHALVQPWDDHRHVQTGFRVDWTPTCSDTLTLQGDYLDGESGTGTVAFIPGPTLFADRAALRRANALLRWSRQLDDESDWSVQMYYDHFRRRQSTNRVGQDVFDLDAQYHKKVGCWHDIVCGFGYRHYAGILDFPPPPNFPAFLPEQEKFGIISYFVQDTITLQEDVLYATLGIKLDHNDFTQFEFQPSAKLVWLPNERTSIWGSIARAVRSPSLVDRNVALDYGFPVGITGNRNIDSEDALSFELGVRRQPTERFYWEVAAYLTRYNDLVTCNSPPILATTSNGGDGDTYGFELAATYEVSDYWNLRGSYGYFSEELSTAPGQGFFVTNPGFTPSNQAYLQSSWDLFCHTTFDLMFRYVDSFSAGLPTGMPSYFEMDARLGYAPTDRLEFALVGRNLLDDQHPEFATDQGTTEIEREAYATVTWEY